MNSAPQDRSTDVTSISGWLIQQGLESTPVEEIVTGFCERTVDAGIPILRVNLTYRAFHPEFGAFAFRWRRETSTERQAFQRRTEQPDDWKKSPLYHLLTIDAQDLHISLTDPKETRDYPVFEDFRAEGATDYFASKITFGARRNTYATDPDDTAEGMILSLTSDGENGFSEADLDFLRALFPALGLAMKAISTHQMAEDLLSTYLGQDAGGRVLSGELQRGSVDRIEAVILYFDLQGFTKLSETLPGPDIIAMLNDYFGSAVPAIHAQGGNVLKFMGDGVLAIYARNQVDDPSLAALRSIDAFREELPQISARRQAEGLHCTGFTVGVHAGEVLYGNIGASDRLDFTVIGSAVNTAARISAMCGNLDQNVVISGAVARPLLDRRPDLVSLGQYRLRGVKDRLELFTVD